MKPIPENIAKYLRAWVNPQVVYKFGGNILKETTDWYRSMKPKHDSSKIYYRGLGISPDGFISFLENSKIKLKKIDMESWTCDEDMGRIFAEDRIETGTHVGAIILRKRIPKNKVIFDFSVIYEMYADKHKEWNKFRDYDSMSQDEYYTDRLLDTIKIFSECELVSSSICTSCSIDEVQQISFRYDQSNKSYSKLLMKQLPEFLEHVELLDWYISNDLSERLPHTKNTMFSLFRRGSKWNVRTDRI